MNLVAYSDSEGSDNEAPPAPKPAAKPAATTSKPAFQKVVDRANPHKIKVNLPSTSTKSAKKDDTEAEGPPAKKARTGGGAFSGFNAMLPAPKKTAPAMGGTLSGAKRGPGRGLGSGVSLRTGAAPAFSREPVDVPDYSEEQAEKTNLSAPAAAASTFSPDPKTEPEIKAVVKPMMFKPLSVVNKKKNKAAIPFKSSSTSAEKATAPALPVEQKPVAKPKVSLFSIPQEEAPLPSTSISSAPYEPILYGVSDESTTDEPSATTSKTPPTSAPPPGPQTLHDIATDLNLSEADRRQLFGRPRGSKNAPDLSSLTYINFNIDAEYAHNEALRAAGETVQHNPIRSIAGTGKNSLRQLLNVATTQKDALEEHFAKGKRNKKESGTKYGF
ncbi:hypothetical protein K432DRAFT_381878 [Lepidopterella palustris CBS 459.81]|uniref:Mitotic checkpoint regulator, MAD2B-interacting-domain-containing protein n=1 Tax=Lepidopterella palustris CBS 459.81 TaxID=1314670 RepID=A0A8E2EBM0_9PEZI|nr:hypothetical protein K432DRAFT_381878 [Lepidopterella palustris CBS 459.81]